ncbi:ABC transporter ATP-binding protein [Hyphomicrobium sp. 1Nfss2.1]|uniref:ABC transporter ATP-binding protein n=1 Tax=Hyphomicrobium sp. 1Nfss2.1 TaxID=3413936 RepID=UPI003C7D81DA
MAYIRMTSVDLHYSALGLADRTLKGAALDLLVKGRNRNRLIRDIHALKNISLEIRAGERIGLLGHNGAGKSTLLKAIAGLYPPSAGTLQVVGGVRALIEISLGFEPDATGRENILFRGLLMGLSPKQVRALEDEIVAFADIGEFIDYPIKTYSSGMQVRLAFAVSVAVSGEILLLDEIIGAGDATFMEKAKARVRKLIEHSQILILASHDFTSLASMCERGLVLHHGQLIFDGPIAEAVATYKTVHGLAA